MSGLLRQLELLFFTRCCFLVVALQLLVMSKRVYLEPGNHEGADGRALCLHRLSACHDTLINARVFDTSMSAGHWHLGLVSGCSCLLDSSMFWCWVELLPSFYSGLWAIPFAPAAWSSEGEFGSKWPGSLFAAGLLSMGAFSKIVSILAFGFWLASRGQLHGGLAGNLAASTSRLCPWL